MMKNEEEFLNILKDCWTGRKYFCEGLPDSSIIEITEDDGREITFKVRWVTGKPYTGLATFKVSNKQEFIDGLLSAECRRIK